jgi:hypothetical protein
MEQLHERAISLPRTLGLWYHVTTQVITSAS